MAAQDTDKPSACNASVTPGRKQGRGGTRMATRKKVAGKAPPKAKPKTAKKARPRGGLTVADVRELALALPATEERPSYGTPGFRVSDKLFARVLDDDSIVVKVDFELREVLLDSKPRIFQVTPHYQDWPMVIVRLAPVGRPLLKSLLEEAWRQCASPRVLAAKAPTRKKLA
jgi:hypothetical protein